MSRKYQQEDSGIDLYGKKLYWLHKTSRVLGNFDNFSAMTKLKKIREAAVDQLVERSLLTPEVCSLNPVIGNIFFERFIVNRIEKSKI